MIYVTASGGHVGREIAKQAAKTGERVRVLAPDAEEAKALQAPGIEVLVGDRRKPATFADSLQGIDTAILLTRNAEDLADQDAQFAKAARSSGVTRIVKISAFNASLDESGAKKFHAYAEEAIKDSGLGWTFLRPQFFMQNTLWFAEEIRNKGTFTLPMKTGRVGMIDFRDLAAVAAKCATDPSHAGKLYNLSGPELISPYDIAEKIARAIGQSVKYYDMEPDDFRKLLISLGKPEWLAEEMTRSWVAMSKGRSAVLTDEVKRVLGRDPTPFEQVARDYAHHFRRDSSGTDTRR